jgi:Domain of unknown function (DUF4124)
MEDRKGMTKQSFCRDYLSTSLICQTLSLLLLFYYAPSQANGIQRWIDEGGVVHYGDKIPPEYAGHSSIELNKQGIRIKEKNRVLTDIEREHISKEQLGQQEVLRLKQEQQRRDRSLLDTYANTDEIRRNRKRILEAMDNDIHVTEVRLNDIAQKKITLDEQLQKNLTQSVFSKLSAERASFISEIGHLNDIVLKRKNERQQADQKYSADLKRYEEIINAIAQNPNTTPKKISPPL